MPNLPKRPLITYRVTFRPVIWRDMVIRAWGTEWSQDDHNIYLFSNGRGFDSTDRGITGIYNKAFVSTDGIVLQSRYPDAKAFLMTQSGFKILLEQ